MTSEARTTFVLVEKLLQKLFTGWRVRRVSGAGLNHSVYPRFAVMCLFVLAALQSVSSLVMKLCDSQSYCDTSSSSLRLH